jgi:AIPR protein
MDLSEYRGELLEELNAKASVASNFTHSMFVEMCAEALSDAEEISDFEACYYRGTGSHNRSLAVDGFAQDSVDGSLRLVVADFSGDEELRTLNQTQAKSTFAKLIAFCEDAFSGRLQDSLEESAPAHSLASLLYQQRKQIVRLRLYLVSDLALSVRVRDWPEGSAGGIPTEFHIWDINRFYQVYESKTGRDELTVDFTEVVPGGLPCLAASVEADNYRAYLCVIPGAVLADIYQQFGSRLLEGNVRSFLGSRGRINKMIRKTITAEPAMFFAYNNGIAATATNAVVDERNGLHLTKVTDLQIVNGGQTTATLASALAEKDQGLGQAFVQMKLSVIPPETSGQYIPLIARYANSQNKVSDADFFSNHEFHQQMEQISRVLRAPAVGGAQYGTHWRYERARGTYLNEQTKLTKAQRNLFKLQNPPKQLITKVDLAKYENAWRFLPNIVSQGAQKNFVAFSNYIQAEWVKNPAQFNEEYYKRVLVKAMLFRRTEDLVSDQAWYQNGYRANIVAYTIAKFSHVITFEGTGELFDFKACWARQALSPAMESQLTLIAGEVFNIIVTPEAGFQNVTEWAKKELCWTRVQGLRIPLSADLAKELVGREDDKKIKAEAEVDENLKSGIELQTAVINLGGGYWKKLHTWGRQRALFSPDEDSIVAVAGAIPRRIPTEKQCKRLMDIKHKAKQEGFPEA